MQYLTRQNKPAVPRSVRPAQRAQRGDPGTLRESYGDRSPRLSAANITRGTLLWHRARGRRSARDQGPGTLARADLDAGAAW